ncbi:MAG: hypothetical protein ACRDSP_22175 [Pseudonocardiaceae bacterium]
MRAITEPPVVMRREHERSRAVVAGKRTDDGTQCTLLVVREVGGDWCLYPHGVATLGVRLSRAEACASLTLSSRSCSGRRSGCWTTRRTTSPPDGSAHSSERSSGGLESLAVIVRGSVPGQEPPGVGERGHPVVVTEPAVHVDPCSDCAGER